jgi:hypothetical protein
MKILLESYHLQKRLLEAADIKNFYEDPIIHIISNKPTSFNECPFINCVLDKDTITTSLDISCNSDIEVYLVDSELFTYVQYFDFGGELSRETRLLHNTIPNPLRNIKFDIFIHEDTDTYSYYNPINARYDLCHKIMRKDIFYVTVDDKVTYMTDNKDQLRVRFHEEFKKIVQLVDSEPIIEAKPLEEQIAELREMVSAYFPIREMEKLKLKVAELELRNDKLENRNKTLKKVLEDIDSE